MYLMTQIELLPQKTNNLHFPSKEAIDRLAKIKQKENQLEQLQEENARLREFEANFEDVQVCYSQRPPQRNCVYSVVIFLLFFICFDFIFLRLL